jgi:hypothetical protein
MATVLGSVAVASPASAHHKDKHQGGKPKTANTIPLPAGFAPEGVATGKQGLFYAGSRNGGQIARGSLRTGTSAVFVPAAGETPLTTAATGLKADVRHGLLWVAGAGTGMGAVYDLNTGHGIKALTFTTSASFINDVVVTKDAAYFTNSLTPVIYRVPVSRTGVVGDPQTINVTGPAGAFLPGFNINGIAATQNGRTLIVVNSQSGKLFTINARTGESQEINLGGNTVKTGDGILLEGRTLYVLQNGNGNVSPNQIAVVRLQKRLTSGKIVRTLTSTLFQTATTLARSGSKLLAVNAEFSTPPPFDAEVVVLPHR